MGMSMPTKKPQRRRKNRALDRPAAGLRAATREARHKCHFCQLPGEYEGYVFEMIPDRKAGIGFRSKEVPMRFCERHQLMNMFGLWPVRCGSEKCVQQQLKKADALTRPEDFTIWFPSVALFGGSLGNCPWCRKPLRVVPEDGKPSPPPPPKKLRQK